MEEIINQISQYLPQIAATGVLGASLGYIGLAGSSYLGSLFSEKVTSQEHLERMVQEESEKLGMEVPEAVLCEEDDAGCARSDDDRFRVRIGGTAARRDVVKHEVYHAFKKHPKKPGEKETPFKHYLIDEPQAMAYAHLGVKL